MTVEELIAFERDIADCFERGEIRAPVHLHGGNEEQLRALFCHINPSDWVFSTHRSHYHALLKGVPPELVKAEILKGNSISLQFPEYHFFTSAIVGGILPIALGVAMSGARVWCFVGEMSSSTGIFYECHRYAAEHELPITFVIEDNMYSVQTPSEEVWGSRVVHYSYERCYPHQGASEKWIIF